MPRKLKFYVWKNKQRLQNKSVGTSSAPVSLYKDVASSPDRTKDSP